MQNNKVYVNDNTKTSIAQYSPFIFRTHLRKTCAHGFPHKYLGAMKTQYKLISTNDERIPNKAGEQKKKQFAQIQKEKWELYRSDYNNRISSAGYQKKYLGEKAREKEKLIAFCQIKLIRNTYHTKFYLSCSIINGLAKTALRHTHTCAHAHLRSNQKWNIRIYFILAFYRSWFSICGCANK